MLDLRRLRLLRELEARGTLAAVAEALDFTPSAVSQGLAALEREAGTALLRRSGRRVVLTDAGRVLARHASGLLDGVAAAEAELAEATGQVAGPVTVVAFQSAMLRIVAPALPGLARDHPQIQVTCSESELEDAIPGLRLGTVDIACGDEWVGTPRRPEAGLTRTPLVDEEVRLALPADHPLAAHERVPLSALAGAAWATARPGTGHHAAHLRHCRAVGGFEPDLRHASNDLVVLLALVRQAGAVSLMPDLAAAADTPGVVLRRIAEGNLARRVYTLTRTAGETRPALQAVLGAMQAQAATV